MSILTELHDILNESVEYPIQDPPDYGDRDYTARGGVIINTTPDKFLSKVPPLHWDDETEEDVDGFVDHIRDGQLLDPATVYIDGKGNIYDHDGRHRAYAAKKLGINTFPVLVISKEHQKLSKDLNFDSLAKQEKYNR